jgi:hypothetical protein
MIINENNVETVHLDEQTEQILLEAEELQISIQKNNEANRLAKVEQVMFVMGATTALKGDAAESTLHANSDGYFSGYDYGRRINNDILNEAKKRFPVVGNFPSMGF